MNDFEPDARANALEEGRKARIVLYDELYVLSPMSQRLPCRVLEAH
jgi:hypothetical protein